MAVLIGFDAAYHVFGKKQLELDDCEGGFIRRNQKVEDFCFGNTASKVEAHDDWVCFSMDLTGEPLHSKESGTLRPHTRFKNSTEGRYDCAMEVNEQFRNFENGEGLSIVVEESENSHCWWRILSHYRRCFHFPQGLRKTVRHSPSFETAHSYPSRNRVFLLSSF